VIYTDHSRTLVRGTEYLVVTPSTTQHLATPTQSTVDWGGTRESIWFSSSWTPKMKVMALQLFSIRVPKNWVICLCDADVRMKLKIVGTTLTFGGVQCGQEDVWQTQTQKNSTRSTIYILDPQKIKRWSKFFIPGPMDSWTNLHGGLLITPVLCLFYRSSTE
jgi:hypothetical protein